MFEDFCNPATWGPNPLLGHPATSTPTAPAAAVSRSGYPTWILKQDGLESSGQRLISSIGKTKIIAFFSLVINKYSSKFEIKKEF